MTESKQLSFKFKGLKGRPIELDFNGGDISSNGGSVLLAQADKNLDLLRRAAEHLVDTRDQNRVKHSQEHMLRQRVFGVALAYEDLNDHDNLRNDSLFCAMVGKTTALASSAEVRHRPAEIRGRY